MNDSLEIGERPKNPAPGAMWTWSMGNAILAWRYIPPGISEMGSRGYYPDEEPIHEVEVREGFWMLETPVTQAQWLAVRGGENPSFHRGSEDWRMLPVERITWPMAREWCRSLQAAASDQSSVVVRVELPTESQWEYACRAGNHSEFAGGDGEERLHRVGWYAGNSGGKTQAVKQKSPNAWGLFDMHGNVWEWCLDAFDAHAYEKRDGRAMADDFPDGDDSAPRVLRGGNFGAYRAVNCRSAFRNGWQPDLEGDDSGFRACLFPGPVKH